MDTGQTLATFNLPLQEGLIICINFSANGIRQMLLPRPQRTPISKKSFKQAEDMQTFFKMTPIEIRRDVSMCCIRTRMLQRGQRQPAPEAIEGIRHFLTKTAHCSTMFH